MGLVLGLVCFFILLREKVVEAGGHLRFCVPKRGRKILLKKKRRILNFFIRDLKTEFFIKFKFKYFLNKLKAIMCITLIAFSVTNHWKCDRRTNLVIFLTLRAFSFK